MTAIAHEITPDVAGQPIRTGPAVRRLTLSRFRNYESLRLDLDRSPVVLTGANGAGKTNLLEALSFLAPGRGLRRARLSDADRLPDANRPPEIDRPVEPGRAVWAMSADVEGARGRAVIGTGRDPVAAANGGEKRVVRVDGHPAKSQTVLAEHLAVSWLTPQMDRLFIDGASQRRRFLDRMVYAFDSRHAGRMNGYTHALRERGRLLREGHGDAAWHAALEDQIAASGVAVAAARRELISRLGPIARAAHGPFPGAVLSMDGEIDAWLNDAPALDVEDRVRAALVNSRRLVGGEPTPVPGPHRGDLRVRHSAKDMPAERCSTGEQKALLIAIVLAHARLRANEAGGAPLLLLDEVAAHLDGERRAALYDILRTLGSQVWLTGTDAALFETLAPRAQVFAVRDGTLSQR